MIDDKLKPWLMEINLSPSLSLESNMDIKLKTKLITEMFNLYGFRKLSTSVLLEGTPWDEESKSPKLLSNETPKHKCKNYKFRIPELSEEQIEEIIEKIEEEDMVEEEKKKCIDILKSKHTESIFEVLAEYTRKKDYIRIFPAKGSDSYFKFFKYDLEVNKKLYEILYE